MNNWIRLGISALVSLILTVIAYFLLAYYFYPALYFFAPGSYLGDALPQSFVNAIGDGLFTIVASGVVWALVIFGVWWLIARPRRRY
jgi:hypothetical protein